jgi:hypothetical protein
MTTFNFRRIQLLVGLLILTGNALANSKLTEGVRAAVARKDGSSFVNEAKKLSVDLSLQLSKDDERRIYEEVLATIRSAGYVTPTVDALLKRIDDGNAEGAYRAAIELRVLAMREGRPIPRIPTLAEFRAQVAADPTFLNYLGLAIAASMANQFGESLHAAEEAWKRRNDDVVGRSSAEPIHRVEHLAAFASFQMGRHDEAVRHIMRSLDFEGRSSTMLYPDMMVAWKLLEAGQRDSVIAYLEKCLQGPFRPASKTVMAQWLQEIRAGRTPRMVPPADR